MVQSDKDLKRTAPARLFEVDCVKFFAIIFMICVHVYEQLSVYDHIHVMPDSFFHYAVEFAGGPLAAPVFMFCMGIGMVYTRHNKPSDFCKRGLKLLLMGYVLNFFRQTLLQLIGMIVGIDTDMDIIGGLLCVDILEFAGITFLVVGLMKQMKFSVFSMCIVAVALQAVGIWATELNIESMALQCLIGLFLPVGFWVAFPLTIWLVYPVLGMAFGEILKGTKDRSLIYRKTIVASGVFVLAFTGVIVYSGLDIRDFFVLYDNKYYKQSLLGTLWIISIVFLVISICYYLLRRIEQTKIGAFIKYCSINLNRIYIVQWLIITYSLAVITVIEVDKISSPLIIVAVSLAVLFAAVGINALYMKIRARLKKSRD